MCHRSIARWFAHFIGGACSDVRMGLDCATPFSPLRRSTSSWLSLCSIRLWFGLGSGCCWLGTGAGMFSATFISFRSVPSCLFSGWPLTDCTAMPCFCCCALHPQLHSLYGWVFAPTGTSLCALAAACLIIRANCFFHLRLSWVWPPVNASAPGRTAPVPWTCCSIKFFAKVRGFPFSAVGFATSLGVALTVRGFCYWKSWANFCWKRQSGTWTAWSFPPGRLAFGFRSGWARISPGASCCFISAPGFSPSIKLKCFPPFPCTCTIRFATVFQIVRYQKVAFSSTLHSAVPSHALHSSWIIWL